MTKFKLKFKACLLHDLSHTIFNVEKYVTARTPFLALLPMYDKYDYLSEIQIVEVDEDDRIQADDD